MWEEGAAKALQWPLDHNLEVVPEASGGTRSKDPLAGVSQKPWALIPVQSLTSHRSQVTCQSLVRKGKRWASWGHSPLVKPLFVGVDHNGEI